MNQQFIILKNWFPFILILCLVGIFASLLSGCNGSNQQQGNSSAGVASIPTSPGNIKVPAMQATSTVTYPTPEFPFGSDIDRAKQAGETKVAANHATRVTILTLTPRVTPPSGPVYLESPVPTATWATGYGGGLDIVSPYLPEYFSCWNGYYHDTKPMEVCAGHQTDLGGDSQQGTLQIRIWEPDQATVISIEAYKTPEKVGVMHIVVADSSSVTIASEDGQHLFTFDIATRQWVPNPPLPSPSPSLPPVPTLTTVP